MFSTADHSNYCLAHIWTYRRLEVLGLADTPTAGSAGLSGFCAFYDHDCKVSKVPPSHCKNNQRNLRLDSTLD